MKLEKEIVFTKLLLSLAKAKKARTLSLGLAKELLENAYIDKETYDYILTVKDLLAEEYPFRYLRTVTNTNDVDGMLNHLQKLGILRLFSRGSKRLIVIDKYSDFEEMEKNRNELDDLLSSLEGAKEP